MNEPIHEETVGRYVVKVYADEDYRVYLLSRDCDNVGRVSVPSDGGAWTFQDDALTYREAREEAGEPILALPFSYREQSYGILQESTWEHALGFYWAPMSAIEREGFHGVEGLRDCLRSELQTLAMELEGDVYGYVVTLDDEEANCDESSCWGFIGPWDGIYGALHEGIGAANWANHRDAIDWANLPEWVQQAVLIQVDA